MRRTTRYKVGILAILGLGVALYWYYSPVQIEDVNRMVYCACGYSEVQFTKGSITMLRYHHDSPKPGDLIGKYVIIGKEVELEIYFKGKTNVSRCKIDNIGLRDSDSQSIWKYQAYCAGSLKNYPTRLLQALR